MIVSNKIKVLLDAHEMVLVNDFIDCDSANEYLDSTNLSKEEIYTVIHRYEGYGICGIEDEIIRTLKLEAE